MRDIMRLASGKLRPPVSAPRAASGPAACRVQPTWYSHCGPTGITMRPPGLSLATSTSGREAAAARGGGRDREVLANEPIRPRQSSERCSLLCWIRASMPDKVKAQVLAGAYSQHARE